MGCVGVWGLERRVDVGGAVCSAPVVTGGEWRIRWALDREMRMKCCLLSLPP